MKNHHTSTHWGISTSNNNLDAFFIINRSCSSESTNDEYLAFIINKHETYLHD